MLKEDVIFFNPKIEERSNLGNPIDSETDNTHYHNTDTHIPEEMKKYLSTDYLTNYSNCNKAVNKILDYFKYHVFKIPPESIKSLILILEDKSILKIEFVSKTLFILDTTLASYTSGIKLTNTEIYIVRKYFPNYNAINILSHAIKLNPNLTTFLLELFPPKENYMGFNETIISLMTHDFENNYGSALNLILTLSEKFEIVNCLTSIYQALIPLIPYLPFSEQFTSFKILINFCKQDKKYISILYNNDSVQKLYSNITNDDKLLRRAFKFLLFISESSEQSLSIIKRLKINAAVQYAIENYKEKAIRIISNVFYNVLLDDNETVNYFLENNFINSFLSLQTQVSFVTWQEIMTMICVVVYKSTSTQQIEYMLQTSNIIQCIAEISENVDQSIDKTQNYISESISYALKNLFEIGKCEYERNNRKIFSQELRNQLLETSIVESYYDYHPTTDFIRSIDMLYSNQKLQ